ncbi:hypothetical protein ACQUJT_17290, partial [Ralstonia pseudosolanacearum]
AFTQKVRVNASRLGVTSLGGSQADFSCRGLVYKTMGYKVLSKKEKSIRGEVIECRVIRQEWGRNVIDYAYSKDYGVLAIKGKNGHVMMALGKCGFAAISKARGC